jgi:hypothetical protein
MFIKPFPFLLLFRKIAAIQIYAENTLLDLFENRVFKPL